MYRKDEKNGLEELSNIGHFLKGSSAAIGVKKLQQNCQNIQNHGKLLDEKNQPITKSKAFELIESEIGLALDSYTEAKKYLKGLYGESDSDETNSNDESYNDTKSDSNDEKNDIKNEVMESESQHKCKKLDSSDKDTIKEKNETR